MSKRKSKPTPSTHTASIHKLVTAGLLNREVGNTLDFVFRCMEIAEEEIEAGKSRHPTASDRIHDAFKNLHPTDALAEMGEKLYHAHAKELIERVALETDIRPGTTAEIVATLSRLSTVAPFPRYSQLLYEKLFTALFPREAEAIFTESHRSVPDSYEVSQMEELEAEFRRKLSCDRTG